MICNQWFVLRPMTVSNGSFCTYNDVTFFVYAAIDCAPNLIKTLEN